MSTFFFFFIIIKTIKKITSQYSTYKIDFKINKISNEEIKGKIFSHYNSHDLITRICFGFPNQCLNINITFNSYYTWLCSNNKSNFYNPNLSSTVKKLKEKKLISSSNHIIEGNYYNELIDMENNENTNINLLLITNSNCFLIGKGELSLGNEDLLHLQNINESFIDQLYDNEIISNKIISIKYNNETNGEIILGDSYEIYDNEKYIQIPMISYSIITSSNFVYRIDLSSNLYSSNYHKIKSSIEINRRLILNFNSSFIFVNKIAFFNISNVTFSSYFTNSICKLKFNKEFQSDWIVCSKHILNTKLDNLNIFLSTGEKIEINLSKLFLSYKKDKLIFGIISKPNLQYIILGDIFLRRFNIFLDKENKIIRLYSNNIKVSVTNINPFSLIFMFIFGLSLILCMWNIGDTLFKKKPTKKKYSPKYEKFLQKKDKELISV